MANGASEVSRVVLGAFQVAVVERFLVMYHTGNFGVATIWNRILEVAFETNPAVPYVVISKGRFSWPSGQSSAAFWLNLV